MAGLLDGVLGSNANSKLMQFLQSPAAIGLSMGLLKGGEPGGTLSGGFGQGLGFAQQFTDLERKRKLEEAAQELEKLYKTGMLDINREDLGLRRAEMAARRAEHAASLGLRQQELELERIYKQAQIDDLISKGKTREAEQLFYESLLNDEGISGDLLSDVSPEQRRAAGIAGMLGSKDAAIKALLEKDPTQSPTTSTITAVQEQLRALDAAIPGLERLKSMQQPDIPGVPGGELYSSLTSPSQTKIAKKKIKDIAKDYLAAKQTNITDASIKAAVDVLSKAPGESQADYAARIDEIIGDLQDKYSYASSVVKPTRAVKSTRTYTVRNKKTGETREVSAGEAKRMGIDIDE